MSFASNIICISDSEEEEKAESIQTKGLPSKQRVNAFYESSSDEDLPSLETILKKTTKAVKPKTSSTFTLKSFNLESPKSIFPTTEESKVNNEIENQKQQLSLDIQHQYKTKTKKDINQILSDRAQKQQQLEQEKFLKQQDKLQKKKEKELEKERLKLERELEKKTNMANRVADKHKDITEISLYLDSQIPEIFRREIKLELEECGAVVFEQSNPYSNTILWKRRTDRRWDEQEQAFVPLPEMMLYDEKFVMHLMLGSQFAELIQTGEIEKFMKDLEDAFPKRRIILVLYLLENYFKKEKQKVNQAFKQGNGALNPGPKKEDIEKIIFQIQIKKNWSVVHVYKEEAISDWVMRYSREIASGPYRKAKKENDLNFSIDDLGQTGKNVSDTWCKMLQVLSGVTPSIAEAIVKVYPTFFLFYENFVDVQSEKDAIQLLENLPIKTQQNGNIRRLGPAMAKKLWFMMQSLEADALFR